MEGGNFAADPGEDQFPEAVAEDKALPPPAGTQGVLTEILKFNAKKNILHDSWNAKQMPTERKISWWELVEAEEREIQ